MWAIGIRFLTGNCVASNPSDRESAEWPPHPMRIFMAMAAAHFETEGDDRQRETLEWFEALSPPVIYASECNVRSVVTTFVPVNDGKGSDSLGTNRSRQPRTFPTVVPDVDVMYCVWEETLPEQLSESLAEILHNVSRVGHSSSLVQTWLEPVFDPTRAGDLQLWQSNEAAIGGRPLRSFYSGALSQLEASYNSAAIERHADLTSQIASTKGKAKKELQQLLKDEFGNSVPTSQRPESRLTGRYQRVSTAPKPSVSCSHFDEDLLVLALHEGPVLGSETTLRIATALRGAILSQFARPQEIPEWISGHTADGAPAEQSHLAILPLPFVGSAHADGHLLGMALAFPRHVHPRERAIGLRSLLTDEETGEDKPIILTMGKLGKVTLQVETRSAAPLAMRPATWTKPACRWATVTPIVLDRFPKTDRDRDRSGWLREVAEIIDASCRRIGLPSPLDIAINHNAFMSGVPRAKPSGGGFPAYPDKNGKGNRYMVHALLAFDQPVRGPVLLGAGRYLGYGFCKPHESKEVSRG